MIPGFVARKTSGSNMARFSLRVFSLNQLTLIFIYSSQPISHSANQAIENEEINLHYISHGPTDSISIQ